MLGRLARDRVSGFVGIITDHNRTLDGSDRVLLTATAKPNEAPATLWVELSRVRLVDESEPPADPAAATT